MLEQSVVARASLTWNLFRIKEREAHEWHYRGLADALRELQDTSAYKEFEQLINQVF